MVEEAQASSAPIQKIVDKVAAYFVPGVVGTAILSFVIWNLLGNFTLGLLSFIAVLIVACPCAIGIATPAALMVGVGKGAESGILIRNGEVLERAQKLNVVVFDKTGTLTKGEPSVTDVVPIEASQALLQNEVLRFAAIAERGSEHPLGEAIIRGARELNLEIAEPLEFKTIPGKGVSARWENHMILVGNRRLLSDAKIPTEYSEVQS